MTREEKEQWDIFMKTWVIPALKNTWNEKKCKEIVEALEEWEEQEPVYFPPCVDCNTKMNEIREAYDKLKNQEPCDDTINRQDALRAFMYAANGERLPDYDCDNYPVTYDLRYIKKTLRALPPVTPQPKTGHWIDIDGGVECDKCGKWYFHAPIAKNEIKFCSECGAKMVESQESETRENE